MDEVDYRRADRGGVVTPLTERDAERYLAARALTAAHPGFVGLAADLPPTTPGPAGRSRLRHGFLVVEQGRVAVSGPPSPGLEVAVARMAEDLDLAATLTGLDARAAGLGMRVSLEAGTEDRGSTGLRRRWAVAQAIAPVLTAAFANTPVRDGPQAGWRSSRRPPGTGPGAAGRDAAGPDGAGPDGAGPDGGAPDPRTAWARQVLDAPLSPAAPATFREWIRSGGGRRPAIADLEHHRQSFRPPVTARGHLAIDVVDRQPDDGWLVAAAVVTTLVEDPQAAAEALLATAPLGGSPHLWHRAARDALTDPALAAAARSLFLSAYGALARRGAARPIRDAIAGYLDRYVLRGRCPADDLRATDIRATDIRATDIRATDIRATEVREKRS
jgi:glutamate--cysteine ligase